MLLLKAIFLMLVGFTDVIFSFLVLARDSRKINNLSFFVLAFSMGGWSLGIAGFLLSNSYPIAFSWAKLYYFFPLIIALALPIFALSFPDKRVAYRHSLPLFICFLTLAALLLIDHKFITDHIVYHAWGKQVVLNSIEYLYYSAFLVPSFLGSLFIMYKKGKNNSLGLYSTQAMLFFIGFLVASIFGVTFNLILPGFGNYRLIWIGPLFTGAFIIAIAYSIIKHKMFDIRFVIARSISYIASVTLLAFIYGFIVFGASALVFRTKFNINTQIYLSVATGIAGLSFTRLRTLFDRFTNHIFYHDAYDSQTLLDNLNRILVSSTDLTRLLSQTTYLLSNELKSIFCFISIKTGDPPSYRIIGTRKETFKIDDILQAMKLAPKHYTNVVATDYLEHDDKLRDILFANNISILVRLTSNYHKDEEGLGYIIFGPKKSGNLYTNQDTKLLGIVAKELIIATQNAMRFEEIEQFNVTLQEKIKDATHQLRKTNDKLRALDEAKDDFVSMASHQLRTPLTAVKGNISLVLDGDAGRISDTQKQLLDQAFTSSQRMVYLIADLLNVSRLKTGKFIIERAPVDLSLLIEEELNQLYDTAKSRNLTLKYDKPEHLTQLMLDDTKTRQVVMNFVDNAIYYTPSGGKIDVVLTETPTAIECRVIDNGIGVPKSEQHHLFTKFYRAGNARKARPDGTGLGLFMAKKVIVSEGGAIIFETQEGKGSTFGFSFPKKELAVVNPIITAPDNKAVAVA